MAYIGLYIRNPAKACQIADQGEKSMMTKEFGLEKERYTYELERKEKEVLARRTQEQIIPR